MLPAFRALLVQGVGPTTSASRAVLTRQRSCERAADARFAWRGGCRHMRRPMCAARQQVAAQAVDKGVAPASLPLRKSERSGQLVLTRATQHTSKSRWRHGCACTHRSAGGRLWRRQRALVTRPSLLRHRDTQVACEGRKSSLASPSPWSHRCGAPAHLPERPSGPGCTASALVCHGSTARAALKYDSASLRPQPACACVVPPTQPHAPCQRCCVDLASGARGRRPEHRSRAAPRWHAHGRAAWLRAHAWPRERRARGC